MAAWGYEFYLLVLIVSFVPTKSSYQYGSQFQWAVKIPYVYTNLG